MRDEVKLAKDKLAEPVGSDVRLVIEDAIIRDYPLAADVVLETSGFTVQRVKLDGFKLDDLNEQIVDPGEELGHIFRQRAMVERN